jgi:M6 family metalloprotease-like protein
MSNSYSPKRHREDREIKISLIIKLLLIPSICLSVEIKQFQPREGIGGFVQRIGTVNLLILPVEFNNRPFQQPSSYFDQLAERFKAYYLETSNGSLTVIPYVATYTVLATSSSYYTNDLRQLTIDSVAQADPYINFSSYNALMLLHSGVNKQSGGDIMSKFLPDVNLAADGTVIYNVMIVPEKDNYRSSSFGIWCHEFGHQLGLDDLYFFGYWSLMSLGCYNGNGEYPAYLDAYSKYKLGWITPQQAENLILPLKPTSHLFRLGGSYEYFLVEWRKKNGFDSFIPGEGFLIYHIQEVPTYTATILPADAEWDGFGDNGDPWPGSSRNTTPSLIYYDGSPSTYTIRIIAPSIIQIKAYPNPVMLPNTTVFFDAPPRSLIKIFNVAGELVGEAKDNRFIGKLSWSPQNIASGVYIFVAEDTDGNRGYGKIGIVR